MVRALFNRKFTLPALAALFAVGAMAPTGTLNQSISTSGPVPTKPGEPPRHWTEETEATCGMACRYHRANDNLTMQALYLVTKIQKIDVAIQKDPNSTEARTTLGPFCKANDEDLDTCFSRYKDFQKIGLLEIRQSIGKNEDTIARLTTGRKGDGTVEGTALVFETGEENVPYMPDVPTLSELEASYLKGNLKPTGTTYSRAEIQKWSQDLIVNNPKTRYLQFTAKPVVGNPYQEEKSSYSLYMENKAGGGPAPADDRAITQFNKAKGSVEDMAKDKTIADGQFKAIAPSKTLKKDDAITYDAFTQARNVINSKIETDVKRSDQEEQNRKVAGEKKDPTSQPSPGPSGVPAASMTNAGVSREVKVTTGNSGRTPSGSPVKQYGEDEKVARPPEMKNSRYIKYDLGDLMGDIEAK